MRYLLILMLLFSCSKKEEQSNLDKLLNQENIFPPSQLSYTSQDIVLTKNQTMSSLSPNYLGSVGNFIISPSLPSGLTMSSNGIISGTPTQVQNLREYLITLSNDAGFTTAKIKIKINDEAPGSISFQDISLQRGETLESKSVVQSSGGRIDSFTISPSLPQGLVFQNGTLSGSPSESLSESQYTIRATNETGFVEVNFNLEVRGFAPSNLNYIDQNYTIYAGEYFETGLAFYSGDAVSSFTNNFSYDINSFGKIKANPNFIGTQNITINASNEWGSSSTDISVNVLENINGLATGDYHTCVLKNKEVFCWGRNDQGQLGYTSSELCGGIECSSVPNKVLYNNQPIKARKIVSSHNSTCALSDKVVYCWGRNVQGQLGRNSQEISSSEADLVRFGGLVLDGVHDISSFESGYCVIYSANQQIACWGDNKSNQLQRVNPFSPQAVQVGTYSGIEKIASFNQSICVLNDDLTCWGDVSSFSLLNNKVIKSNDALLTNVEDFVMGNNFIVAFNDEGLWALGDNTYGQLSQGDYTSQNKAVAVKLDASTLLTGVDKLFYHENSWCYLKDNNIACVGEDNTSIAGNSTTYVYPQSTSSSLSIFSNMSSGYGNRCYANLLDLNCLGTNEFFQLGSSNELANSTTVVFP